MQVRPNDQRSSNDESLENGSGVEEHAPSPKTWTPTRLQVLFVFITGYVVLDTFYHVNAATWHFNANPASPVVQWNILPGCVKGRSYSCDEVCHHTCDSNALAALTSEAQVQAAMLSTGHSGYTCDTFSVFGKWFARDFDGPWHIHDRDGLGRCSYVSGLFWKPNCSAKSTCGYTRICPCHGKFDSPDPAVAPTFTPITPIHPVSGESPSQRESPSPRDKWVAKKASDCDMMDRLDIHWIVERDENNNLLHHSCTQVCDKRKMICYVPALAALNRQDRVGLAASLGGSGCGSYEGFPDVPNPDAWDGPWIQASGLCGYVAGPGLWRPNCSYVPGGSGMARICGCKLKKQKWDPSLCTKERTTVTTSTTTPWDRSLGLLQGFYTKAKIGEPWQEWLTKVETQNSERLTELKNHFEGFKRTAEKKTRWFIGQDCSGSTSTASCDDVCKTMHSTCDLQALRPLMSENKVRKAMQAANATCLSFEGFDNEATGPYVNWDGPWITDGGNCGYFKKNQRWIANCHVATGAGHARLCPCYGTATELPTQSCINAMTWWHSQWHHRCDDATDVPIPGPIPRHFHFVELGPRQVFINRTFPFRLLTSEAKAYSRLSQEDHLLLDNMRYTLVINKPDSVHFHDELSCKTALRKIKPQLIKIWDEEQDLRYKSDMCRAAALYLEGGIYNDDDQINYAPIVPWLDDGTNFAGAQTDHDHKAFANSFMAATPCHPLLRQLIDLIIEVKNFTGPKANITEPDGLLGPRTVAYTFAEFYKFRHGTEFKLSKKKRQQLQVQLLRETNINGLGVTKPKRNGHYCEHGFYDPVDKKIFACSRP